ncbi:F-box/FBD/LRR-repeat protein At1g13570-like [Rutidosis leptorrhynchoides]|uniref:F-box/FBD/LRR-repeat protein At1g13570-like n=1 Tax=Rutidosis leptorrhynchoides TaxID=125765 RepID=UPI003A99BD1E
MHVPPLKLSTHIFSCVELESLTLHNCSVYSPPTFCGLPNLLRLDLGKVVFENTSLGEIITRSPSLEILSVSQGEIKLVDIAKLINLKELFLPLHLLDHRAITSSLIVDLGTCLPNLQLLSLDFLDYQFLGDLVGTVRVPSSFPCLESLTLYQIDFSCKTNLMFAFELIGCSPKLQTLWISAKHNDAVPPPAIFLSEINSIQFGLPQLRNVALLSFQGSENEILLIKKLLADSPSLKIIDIYPVSSEVFNGDSGRLMVATKLLKFHRASTNAEVDIYWS